MREIKINKIYRHFKGDLYLVQGIATHSETGEKYVVYRALYGTPGCIYALTGCLPPLLTEKNTRTPAKNTAFKRQKSKA